MVAKIPFKVCCEIEKNESTSCNMSDVSAQRLLFSLDRLGRLGAEWFAAISSETQKWGSDESEGGCGRRSCLISHKEVWQASNGAPKNKDILSIYLQYLCTVSIDSILYNILTVVNCLHCKPLSKNRLQKPSCTILYSCHQFTCHLYRFLLQLKVGLNYHLVIMNWNQSLYLYHTIIFLSLSCSFFNLHRKLVMSNFIYTCSHQERFKG